MGRFAPVAPPHLLRKLREVGDFAIGSYHLLLAHDVAARPKLYENLFPRGAFIIMDNSVIELGHPVDRQTMEEACKVVKPNLIVLPDKIEDMELTLEMSYEAISNWRHPEETTYMAVPQGQTLDEIGQCADLLKEYPGISAWGCGRFITDKHGSRLPALRRLQSAIPQSWRYGGFIHLLGFSDNMLDDYKACQEYGVLGIDSAVPLRLGQSKKLLSLSQVDHEPRGDFWERPVDRIEAETIANLYIIRNWAAGTDNQRLPSEQFHRLSRGATEVML